MAVLMQKIGLLALRVPWSVRVGAGGVYVAFLTMILLVPAAKAGQYYPAIPHADKVLHFFSFGGLVLAGRFAFPDPRQLNMPGWLVPVFALIYGAVIELIQELAVQYQRSFEWGDLAADGLGAAAFWLL